MKEKRLGTVFFNGILPENPVFRLVLGTCPTLAVSTSGMNGLGMGAAVIFVLTCSNIFISLLHNLIPDKVRIPAYIVVICTFVTTVQLFMHAYLPDLYKSLGIIHSAHCGQLYHTRPRRSIRRQKRRAALRCGRAGHGYRLYAGPYAHGYCTRAFRYRRDIRYAGIRRFLRAHAYHCHGARRVYRVWYDSWHY